MAGVKKSATVKVMMDWILASQSPRRRELIRLANRPIRFVSADVDELSIREPDPAHNAVLTAQLKVSAIVAQLAGRDALIIGSDTNVAIDGLMLGKPESADEAVAMLRRLRGRTNYVHTGMVLHHLLTGREVHAVSRSAVLMRDYGDDEIVAYVATGDPLDKAGAYSIQHPDFNPVLQIEGCFVGVAGFSLCTFGRLLAEIGLPLEHDLISWCEAHHEAAPNQYEAVMAWGKENDPSG